MKQQRQNKVSKHYKLHQHTIDNIELLQRVYTQQLGIKITATDVIEKLINENAASWENHYWEE